MVFSQLTPSADGLLESPTAEREGRRLMSDQHTQPGTHVCIFEMESKGPLRRFFTAEVVCRVCGVYLSSLKGPENQRNL
jgi:hypothetical protein